MEYRYCQKTNFEDLSSGRVIYGNAGIPNFPVRLINEIYGRCLEYSTKKEDVTVYDPCCGGGYLLTVLGFCNANSVHTLIGSDIETQMVQYANKNLSLLTRQGMLKRMDEINALIQLYDKPSHKEAKISAKHLYDGLNSDISFRAFQADCTKTLNITETVDVIITDVPYGNLVSWEGESQTPFDAMLEQLAQIATKETILGLSMDKAQTYNCTAFQRLERQNIGKRRFEISKLK